jgi:hypothetical protein
MYHSLTEKERQLTELRERTDEKIEHMKREHAQEKLRPEQDRTVAVQEKDLAKKVYIISVYRTTLSLKITILIVNRRC